MMRHSEDVVRKNLAFLFYVILSGAKNLIFLTFFWFFTLTRISKLTSFVKKFYPLPQGAREYFVILSQVGRIY